MRCYIFSGHMRTFKEIKSTFDFTDSHIYIHTYDILGYWDPKTSVKEDNNKITKEYILNCFDIQDRNKVKDIVIESVSSKLDIINTYAQQMNPRKIWYGRPYNFASMHMKRLSALERFFDIKDTVYDYVLLFRPDFLFRQYELIDVNKIKEGSIIIQGTDHYSGNKDWLNCVFVIGSELNMYILKTSYKESFERYIKEYTGDYDPHSYFCFLIKTYFTKYYFIQCGDNHSLINTPGGYCQEVK